MPERPPNAAYRRGEAWLVDLGYVARTRPCLVLSVPTQLQERAVATLVAHTTRPKSSRFEVEVDARLLNHGTFDAQELVTTSQAKMHRKHDELTADQLALVEDAVRQWLGL